MQWAENGSMDNFLVKNPDSSRALILLSIATALRQLHQDRWIHGDLHMGNILISEDDGAFLCDFGLSKKADDGGAQDDTASGTVYGGVPVYTAPELSEPGARRTFASEVFAFGMIIFQAYSGTRPFVLMANREVAQHEAAIIKAIVNGRRPTRDQVTRDDFSDEMWNLVQDCWNQDPARRPSMGQVVGRMISMLTLLPSEETKFLMRAKRVELTLFQPGDVALDDAMQSHESSAELRWSLSRMEHFGLKRFFTHHIDARDRIVVGAARGMLYGRAPLVDRQYCDPEVLIRLYETLTGGSFAQLAPFLKDGSPYDILGYKLSSSAPVVVYRRNLSRPVPSYL
ncbi:kinase-like protein [Exidia glandulosa HHB12029]|uniref:Kinase-like protein n=1 Tax=Exidia glandulosa HHB12029 TaxID=1314781 RepID=A0A165B366_EXIGL|nr:kinase-like protein [Exidia glandulosa HHB12029]